jgi:hypothetical protein
MPESVRGLETKAEEIIYGVPTFDHEAFFAGCDLLSTSGKKATGSNLRDICHTMEKDHAEALHSSATSRRQQLCRSTLTPDAAQHTDSY